VTANAFRTGRAPTTEELYADGPHLATQSYDIGNENLDLETALGLELGLHLGGAERHFSVNGFYTDFDGFIYQAFTGQTGADILLGLGETDEEELEEFGELDVLRYTGADAVFKGFEIEGRSPLGQAGGFSFSGNFNIDYVDADFSDVPGNDEIPRIPPLGVVAGIEAEHRMGSFRAEIDYAAEADDVTIDELPTDSYPLFNLYADFPIREGINFSVAALNVTDEEARLHTSFLKEEVPLPGRNLRFSLRIDY
jgi:iron complex outermembrane receptor protein